MAALWLIVHLYPQSPAVLGIQSLANFSPIKWLFSNSITAPLILLALQATFLFGVRMLWNSAVHRLENWEPKLQKPQ